MMNYLKRWLGITAMMQVIDNLVVENGKLKKQLSDTRGAITSISNQVDRKMERLDKLATMDLDGGYRGPNTIILTGVFRGRGYVQFYDVDQDEFHHLVQDFRSRERHAMLRVQDLPHYGGGSFQL